jgi:TolA-binding protein
MKKSLLVVLGLTLVCAGPVAAYDQLQRLHTYPDPDVSRLQQNLQQQRQESQRQFNEMNQEMRDFEMQNQMRQLQMQQQMLDYRLK